MTITRISHITIYVEDQDQALRWFVEKFGFEVCIDDDKLLPELRWLTVSPVGNQDTQFVLMPARDDKEASRIGNNLITVLHSDNVIVDMAGLAEQGVEIVQQAKEVPWGVSGIVRDLYGNPYNLVGAE